MNYKQFLYYKLAEEATEVSHAAIKCAMYTPETKSKNGELTRAAELRMELMDLVATINCLEELDEDLDIDLELVPAKMLKTKNCYERSKGLWNNATL